MYTIYNDGQLLYSTAEVDEAHILLDPKLSLDVNGAGSLSFVMPPGHAQYDAIRKLKGIITVEQEGELIFRGRAMDDEKDFYNQKDIYCEGDRSFLLDSQCAPYKYTGTARGLLQKLIDTHNSQVEAEKRFVLGKVTAVDASETLTVENTSYWETWKEIEEKLLSVYGGYMMTRTEGGETALDWLSVSGDTNAQPIQFGVNLLDLRDKADAADVFTVLIPLGASTIGDDGEYSDPVSIAAVNGGLPYIQDDAAVAMYGKIWKSKTWNNVDDPAQLLEKAKTYMKTGIATQTLTLSAIDMHFIDGSAEAIRTGEHVRILSDPHGLDLTIICAKMDIDLQNPENTTYTFGEAPRALTDHVAQTKDAVKTISGGGGGKSLKEELGDVIRWAEIKTNANEATIDLLTGEVSRQGERLSTAEISLDGVNAQIVLKADVETTTELERRVNAAEIEIDGANAQIMLKADASVTDALGKRLSAAEIEIDGANAQIQLKANQSAVDKLGERVSNAEIAIDGANAQIQLKANQSAVDKLGERVSNAEIAIDGANAQIQLKANQSTVDALGERVSAAEIEIDGMSSEITLKANKVYVDAQITSVKTLIADEIKAAYTNVNIDISNAVSTKSLTVSGNAWVSGTMTTTGVSTGSLTLGGAAVSKTTIPVVTAFTQALGESSTAQEMTLLTAA